MLGFISFSGLLNVDITVSTDKLEETKTFYTKYLNFKVLKETTGFISFSPGPGEWSSRRWVGGGGI